MAVFFCLAKISVNKKNPDTENYFGRDCSILKEKKKGTYFEIIIWVSRQCIKDKVLNDFPNVFCHAWEKYDNAFLWWRTCDCSYLVWKWGCKKILGTSKSFIARDVRFIDLIHFDFLVTVFQPIYALDILRCTIHIEAVLISICKNDHKIFSSPNYKQKHTNPCWNFLPSK